MIKIERTPSPKELTQEVVTTKTASYKADHSIVWREPYILHGLLEMSHFKCCYCECRLDEENQHTHNEFHSTHDRAKTCATVAVHVRP